MLGDRIDGNGELQRNQKPSVALRYWPVLLRELRGLKPTVVQFSSHDGYAEPGKWRRSGAPRREVGGKPPALDGEYGSALGDDERARVDDGEQS